MTHEDDSDGDGGVDRRSLLTYAGSGAVAAGLAGCQSPENPLLEPGQGRVPGDEEDETGPTDDDQPLSGETLRVGVLAPMNLPVGESMWRAAQMAADELNDDGGVLGAEVELALGNTEVSPGKAESEHRRLIVNEDCDVTTGIFLGSALLQTMPSIANQKRIHVTTGSAEPRVAQLVSQTDGSLTDDDPMEEYERFKYHFRVGPIHLLDLADAMMEFVEDKKEEFGWERAALLTENIGELTLYHQRLEDGLDDLLEVPVTQRPGGVSDWSPLYNDMEAEGVDIAMIGLALSGTTAVNQWAQQQRDFEMGGIHVPSQAYSFWESTAGNTEYVFTMNAVTPQTTNTELTQPFVQEYIDRFDSVPMYTGPLHRDGIVLIAEAIEACVREEGLESLPDSDTLIPYMENITFTNGTILEEFQFTPPDAEYAHEPQWTSIAETGVPVFQQWQYDPDVREDYGTMHSFYPPQNQTAEYAVPDWIE